MAHFLTILQFFPIERKTEGLERSITLYPPVYAHIHVRA
nr:MAG TPA: hypothetical protein [Caudoviricetes sp.]